MKDENKSKARLIAELQEMRARLALAERAPTPALQTLEKLITVSASRLIAPPSGQGDDAINKILEEIGIYSGVDRSYIFLISSDGDTFSNTHEWCAPGIEAQINNLQNIPVNQISWWVEKLRSERHIHIPRVSAMPPEANAEKEILAAQGIKSVLVMPLVHAGNLLGFAGLDSVNDERGWQEDEIHLLRIITGAITNVLIREQSEKNLLESNQFINSLLRAIPVAVFFKNRHGRYLGCNDSFTRIIGLSTNDIKGKTVFELWPSEQSKIYHQKDLELMNNHEHQEYEYQVKDKDGKIRPVIFAKDVFYDATGEVVGMVGAFMDITDRKQAEEALRAAELRYRTLVEQIPAGTYIDLADGSGISVFASPQIESMFGMSRQEWMQADLDTWLDMMHPEDRQRVRETYHNSTQTGQPFAEEYRMLLKDGRTIWIKDYATPLDKIDGQPGLMHGVMFDITAQKQAETEIRLLNTELEKRVRERTTQLEAANRELEAFSYAVSHDLRAPLRGIDGWSQALFEDYYEILDEQAKQYLMRVRAETRRMGQLINDILRLSKISRAEMKSEQVNLSSLAHKITQQIQANQPLREVSLRIQQGMTVEGDTDLLEIALTNLLENAFKFTSQRERAIIEFGQTTHNGQQAFYVRDNGAGFDMKYAQKLFGTFQRMHKESEFPGTGIGLTTVQRIIHRHGGRIWAQAELDKGATFYFTIG